MPPRNGWIGFDLDGTLAVYNGWVDELHIGEPIQPTVDLVKAYLKDGIEVKIVTARVDGGEAAIAMGDANGERYRDVKRIVEAIQAWCVKHIGQSLEVTNKKDYGMIRLYDDRAVGMEFNTGRLIEEVAYRNGYLKGWQQRDEGRESDIVDG